MKRFNKTAIALATAGALTFGVAPAALADPVPANEGGIPVTLQAGDLVFDKDGNIVTSFSQTDGGVATLKEGDVVLNGDNNVTEARKGPNLGETELDPSFGTELAAPEWPELLGSDGTPVSLKEGDTIRDYEDNVLETAKADGEYFVLQPNDRVVDKNGNEVTNERVGFTRPDSVQPTTLDKGEGIMNANGILVKIATANGEPVVLQAGDRKVSAEEVKQYLTKVGGGILGGLAAVTIAGVLYNVVKNAQGKNVLVPADRADQTPTPEDEKKTEELVANNAAEIAEQAAAQNGAAADRGIGAETGNSNIAKGLLGLVIASIMGAAVFAFGRRQLV